MTVAVGACLLLLLLWLSGQQRKALRLLDTTISSQQRGVVADIDDNASKDDMATTTAITGETQATCEMGHRHRHGTTSPQQLGLPPC